MRNQRVWRLLLLAGLGLRAGALLGQEAPEAHLPPGDPVLAGLISEALARNPDLRAAEEAVRAAQARPAQSRGLPDPMLSVLYTNDGWPPSLGEQEMTTLGLMWSQDLPFPGKRRLRGEIEELRAASVEQQLARARLTLTAQVARAYHALLLARHSLEVLREQEVTWTRIEGVARARYAVGQGVQQDVLRVQIELTRLEQLREEQAVEALSRLAELNRLRDRPPDAALDHVGELRLGAPPGTLEQELERLQAKSPELRNAELAVDRQRKAIELARRDFKPDFQVQGGYMNRGGLDPMWQAGVGVRLPLDRKRRQAAVAESEARLRESERRLEAVRLQLRWRTQERLAQLAAAERIATLYAKGVIPQDQMSVEAATASYQAGKVPFIAVLEALVTTYRDRTTYLRVLAGGARIRAELEEASLEAMAGLPVAGPMDGTSGAGATNAGAASAPTGMVMR